MLGKNTVTNIIVGGVIGGLVALLVVLQVDLKGSFSPIEYETPIHIHNINHQIPLGGELNIHIKRCNTGDESVRNVIVIRFQGITSDGDGGYIEIEGMETPTKVFAVREFRPGCLNQTFEDPLPEEITVGFWKEKGSTTVWNNGDTDVVQWESEVFEVVR